MEVSDSSYQGRGEGNGEKSGGGESAVGRHLALPAGRRPGGGGGGRTDLAGGGMFGGAWVAPASPLETTGGVGQLAEFLV